MFSLYVHDSSDRYSEHPKKGPYLRSASVAGLPYCTWGRQSEGDCMPDSYT